MKKKSFEGWKLHQPEKDIVIIGTRDGIAKIVFHNLFDLYRIGYTINSNIRY